MREIKVDGITFAFPAGWNTSKYDDWQYYRRHFARMEKGIKGVDLLAINPDGTELWLIEAKDFRRELRKKELPLHKEIFAKVRDTLAALLPAAVNANDDSEKNFAITALTAKKIHVVFHGEQPARPSRLFPQSYTQADLLQKLKEMLRAIDPHPRVACSGNMPSAIPWQVQIPVGTQQQ